ncbi:helix-turn-helix domain-containing protein [Sphingomonas sp. TZW2008]|uniref:helix-turn-helix domain-containing protein n=1 Tax=Sphingomonas sp. TZW2008 TaxID=1917973 RepID=UPI000A26CF23|nr:helix-turn-helix domain-containing protein [Sphingomonas sp. TZW2008]
MAENNAVTKLAYSIPEAAAAVSIGRSKLYLLIAQGRLETRKIGKRTVIPTASLLKLLDEPSDGGER